MEHFKETEWSGFFVGSEGTIQNQTGIKTVKYYQDEVLYVGVEYNRKRSMKKVSDLVYRYHIRNGSQIPPDLIVAYKDNNPRNIKADNLYLKERTWSSVNNGHQPYKRKIA